MFGIAIYLIIFAILAWLAAITPSFAILTLFFMFPLDQWALTTSAAYLPGTATTNILAASIVILALIVAAANRGPQAFRPGPVFWLTLILMFYALGSVVWTPVPDQAYDSWKKGAPYILTFCFALPFVIQNTGDITRILKILVLIGIPLMMLIIFYLDWGYRAVYVGASLGKITTNPLALAQFAGHLAIAAALLQVGGTKWKLIRILAILIAGLLILKTGSRGQLVATVLSVTFFYFLSQGRVSVPKLGLAAILATILLVLMFMKAGDLVQSEYVLGREDARWTEEASAESYEGRWKNAWALLAKCQSEPTTMVFGCGNSASYDPKIIGIYPHIVPLEILGEEGLVGFLIYLAILWRSALNVLKILKTDVEDFALRSGLLAFAAFAFFEFLLTLKQGSMLGAWPSFSFLIILERLAFLISDPKHKERSLQK